jgi:hypothetical protein
MPADRKAVQKNCAVCGEDVSNQNMAWSVVGADGKKFPVCSDICSGKILDSLRGGRRGLGREDELLKAVGLPTVREEQIARETDRFLRDLGIA